MTPRKSSTWSRASLSTPYDIREVIARVVDDSWFDEFKPRFGETIVTGFAEIMGLPRRHCRQ